MDKIIQQIANSNKNPGLREDLICDLWNSRIGKEFDSVEDLSEALTEGKNVALIATARQWLGLPIFE